MRAIGFSKRNVLLTFIGESSFIGIMGIIIGIILVIPIGGADMPVVISLLKSCSGLAACYDGFVLNNNLLIVATINRLLFNTNPS